jgi:hypothetical protein
MGSSWSITSSATCGEEDGRVTADLDVPAAPTSSTPFGS